MLISSRVCIRFPFWGTTSTNIFSMLSESALIHFYESVGFFTQELHQHESKMHESWRQCYKWHFGNLPKKKGTPPKLSKSFLRFQSCCFFVVCACFFLMRVGFVLYIYIYILGAECGRWKVLLFLLRRQASS